MISAALLLGSGTIRVQTVAELVREIWCVPTEIGGLAITKRLL